MIYKNFEITVEIPEYTYWGVTEDGSPDWGDMQGDSCGGDVGAMTYEFRHTKESGGADAGELIDHGFKTFEEVKTAIDNHIKKLTTIQSEQGN